MVLFFSRGSTFLYFCAPFYFFYYYNSLCQIIDLYSENLYPVVRTFRTHLYMTYFYRNQNAMTSAEKEWNNLSNIDDNRADQSALIKTFAKYLLSFSYQLLAFYLWLKLILIPWELNIKYLCWVTTKKTEI